MATKKDLEQDELIRQNAEHIRRNEDAILRQTECLEKIRDHYFPRKTFWKSTCGFFLKIVGAVTVGAGLVESFEWYWNARQIESMAEQSVAVARRLMFEESDMAGAMAFLDRAVELEGNKAKYRTMLAYVKGMAAVADLFDMGRPLTPDERQRVDAILAESVFLQTVAPDDPMPHVLSAQAYVLRHEFALANQAVARAAAMAPDRVQVRCSGCAIRYFTGDFAAARLELEAAERLQPEFPLVLYWKGMLALNDGNAKEARASFGAMVRVSPRLALPHAMLGMSLTKGDGADEKTARAEFAKALAISPNMKSAVLMMGESYRRSGDLIVARMWYDRALACDERCMKALLARAEVNGLLGECEAQSNDLAAALALDPFRTDLLRKRAAVLDALGKKAEAEADRKAAAAIEKCL